MDQAVAAKKNGNKKKNTKTKEENKSGTKGRGGEDAAETKKAKEATKATGVFHAASSRRLHLLCRLCHPRFHVQPLSGARFAHLFRSVFQVPVTPVGCVFRGQITAGRCASTGLSKRTVFLSSTASRSFAGKALLIYSLTY